MRYTYLLLLVPCALGLVYLAMYFMADIALAQSRKTTNPIAVYDQANLAYKLNSHEPTITSELAYSAAYLAAALNQKDPQLSGQFLDVALAASDQSILQSPQNPSLYRTRARTLLLLANIDKKYLQSATQTLIVAQILAPTDPRIPAQLSQIATDSATYTSQTLLLKPDYQF